MIPTLRSKPFCLCALRDTIDRMDEKTRYAIISYGAIHLMKLALDQAARHCVTVTFDSIPDSIKAFEKFNKALSSDDLRAMLNVSTPESPKPDETLRRKPWLRLQQDYERNKVRRKGRPKKTR